jgi:hypothetical protein
LGSKMLVHDPPTERLQGIDKRLTHYQINGKKFGSSKSCAPPPEQNPRVHWLCQVNGMTGRYNIVNNRPEDPNVIRHRDEELDKLRTTKLEQSMAGEVQPTRPIACYEMRSFVPLRHHHQLGAAERHHSLFS